MCVGNSPNFQCHINPGDYEVHYCSDGSSGVDKWSVLGRLTVAEGRDGTSMFLIFLNVIEQE